MTNRWITVIPLCSSSRRYCRIKSLINISMKQWWSSLAKYFRTLLTRQISRNWKKRSIVFSDRMLLISRKEYSLKSLEKRSSPSWWMHHQRKPMLKWLKDLSNVSASLSTQLFYITFYRESYRQSYLRAKTEIRPLFTRLTPHGAVQSRSPLVSMIFPSLKDKTKIF